MRRLVVWPLGVAIVAAACVPPVMGEITAQQVRESIARSVDYLKGQQKPRGDWGEWIGQPGGQTALVALALLNSGVEPDEKPIQAALNYLRSMDRSHTYCVALQTMVFCRAGQKRDLPLIRQNVAWLERAQSKAGLGSGGWGYEMGSDPDNSNSQFALLGLDEAERAGAQVSQQTWRLAKAYWESCQQVDGSWGYKPVPPGILGQKGTGSMTCAGISSLVIAAGKIREPDAEVQGDRIQCCQRAQADNDRIERGLEWLGRNFSVSQNPNYGRVWHFYYLYGLERAGRLSNRRLIGGHDWYREGADYLVNVKGGPLADRWAESGPAQTNELVATSFALLFLSKGRWPVLVGKLKHGQEENWNQHRSDLANLTRYVELKWNRDLVWQVTDPKPATVEDLVQSPVLYLCGSNSPLPDAVDARQEFAQKLRAYLDRGGFLLAEAHCGGAGFDAGFRKLVEIMFPEPEYRLSLLPPEHAIWRMEEPIPPMHVRPLLGIEYGCRTSVVYSPPDTAAQARPPLSCLWELWRGGRDQKYGGAVKEHVQAGMSLGINIMAYATNRELRDKTDFVGTPPAKAKADKVDRGRLYIASLRHPGGCTAAPRALTNLLEAASSELRARFNTEPREITITDPALFDHHLVFMHGRNAFRLTDAERKQLKTYLERGGMLFADAICASRQFTESFRREVQAIFPEQPMKAIPPKDPLWTRKYSGFDLSAVKRREPQNRAATGALKAVERQGPPELEAVQLGDRYAVIFSPYDLSCALEKQETVECEGYTRDDAARIGLNVVLYSLQW